MQEYVAAMKKLAKANWYRLPVLLAALLAYTFAVTHYSVSADDTQFDFLFDEYGMLGQGRYTLILLQKTFGMFVFRPFVLDFLAVCFLVLAATMFCALFWRASGGCLHKVFYPLFACLFVTYPLINEIFVYMVASFNVCFNYAATALALWLATEYLYSRRKRFLLFSGIVLFFSIPMLQSMATVYLCGAFCVLLLRFLYGKDEDLQTVKTNAVHLLWLLLPLAAGVVASTIVSSLVTYLSGLPNYSDYIILWRHLPFAQALKSMLKDIWLRYVLVGLLYLPITVYVIAGVLCVILTLVLWIKTKRFAAALIGAGIGLSTLALSFLQGINAPYRTCQVFALFIAFIIALCVHFAMGLSHKKKGTQIVRMAAASLCFLLAFWQACDLNKWFYVDYMAYTEDRNTMMMVMYELEKSFDTTKPVVFTGAPDVSDNILQYTVVDQFSPLGSLFAKWSGGLGQLKYVGTSGNSFLQYAVNYATDFDELHDFLLMHGYVLQPGTTQMKAEGLAAGEEMPVFPKEGSIQDMGEYILVKL